LARLALAGTYAKPGESSGPVPRETSIQNGRIKVLFDHASHGLVAKGGSLRQFSIARADGRFVWADAVIDGDAVVVSTRSFSDPAFVRYAWADNPAGANLYNSDGLPAAPFRTDP
jgi:sialate O-acetylesterase